MNYSNWQNRHLIHKLHDHMYLFGYNLVETPVIEDADLFLTKAGDQIAERLFIFERYGHQLALRPEFTAAAAHKYIKDGLHTPARWQFSGPIFEDSPPGLKHNFQTMSTGAELLGVAACSADAEIISMAIQAIVNTGIKYWKLVIGHVGLTRRLLEHYALDARTRQFILHRREMLAQPGGKKELLSQLDQYLLKNNTAPNDHDRTVIDLLPSVHRSSTSIGQRTHQEITQRLLAKQKQSTSRDQILGALEFLQKWMSIEEQPESALSTVEQFIGADIIAYPMLQEWHEIISLLEIYGIHANHICIKPDLARTWDYYTGIIFEITSPIGVQLAGGGRYDELAHLLGSDVEVPAVGVAFFVDAITQHLDDEKTPVQRILNLVYNEKTASSGIKWANILRSHGYAVAVFESFEPSEGEVLRIREDGNIGFKSHIFTQEQLDFLLMTLDEGL